MSYEEYEHDCCMCGGSLDNPYGCYAEGHYPVSMKEYYEEQQRKLNERTNTMNYTSAVMLINENIRAIHVTYEPEEEGRTPKQRYTFKTMDKTIKEGDMVVIPTDTRHNMTVAKVVDTDVEVDFESSIQLKWLIGKVDEAPYQTILDKENEWVTLLKQSEKRRKREEIKKNVFDMYEDTGFDTLAIAQMDDPTTTDVMLEAQEKSN